MYLTISTTLKESVLHRRLQQIFGTDFYVSAVGANLEGYNSIGTGNNVAVKYIEPGKYKLWLRHDVYGIPDYNTDYDAIKQFIERIL